MADRRDRSRERNLKEKTLPQVHEIFVGQQVTNISNSDRKRNYAVSENIRNIKTDGRANYNAKAVMSVDGLIRPISVEGAGGDLPRYARHENSCVKGHSKSAQPPLTGSDGSTEQYNLEIDIDYLDPVMNPPALQDPGFLHINQSGHDIDIVGRDDNLPTNLNNHVSLSVDNLNPESPYREDYRYFALRGPMIMAGWGYDINGKPVPNAADTVENARLGIFEDENLQDSFLDDWLGQSDTYPVGPIDLRWDRDRACWVSPPAYKLVRLRIKDEAPDLNNCYKAYQEFGDIVYENDGTPISFTESGNEVLVDGNIADLTGGQQIVAYYDTDTCKYWPLVFSESSGGTIDIYDSSCDPTGSSTNTEPLLVKQDVCSIDFGIGLGARVTGDCGVVVDLTLGVGTQSGLEYPGEIVFGDGFTVTSQDDNGCSVLVEYTGSNTGASTTGFIDVYNRACNTTTDVLAKENAEFLNFGRGLIVTVDGDGATIDGGVQLIQGGECDAAAVPAAGSTALVESITAGFGLSMQTTGTCGGVLQSILISTNLTGCFDRTPQTDGNALGSATAGLLFGKGLNAYEYTDQTYPECGNILIDLDIAVKNSDNTIPCDSGTAEATYNPTGIDFGRGLKAYQGANDCEALVGLSFFVGEYGVCPEEEVGLVNSSITCTNSIQVLEGLKTWYDESTPEAAMIGLAIPWENKNAGGTVLSSGTFSSLELGACLSGTQTDPCNLKVDIQSPTDYFFVRGDAGTYSDCDPSGKPLSETWVGLGMNDCGIVFYCLATGVE